MLIVYYNEHDEAHKSFDFLHKFLHLLKGSMVNVDKKSCQVRNIKEFSVKTCKNPIYAAEGCITAGVKVHTMWTHLAQLRLRAIESMVQTLS